MSDKAIMPADPSQADHRMIQYVLKNFFADKACRSIPKEYNRISKVFRKAGGSWERLFKGSVNDVNLLKVIVKVAIKNGVITKREKFR